jgi:alginate O-acetyltransferase complex protein AlgI
MIFLTYEFVWFALAFFALYYIAPWPHVRLIVVIVAGLLFQFYYGGWASVVPIGILAIATFFAGRSGNPTVMLATIVVCVTTLAVYKYSSFAAIGVVGAVAPDLGNTLHSFVKSYLPATIPLGISFFTFEFVHYLTDLRHRSPPIRRLSDFLAFALFWPTMVAGPIKRYQQFVPSLHEGLARPTSNDAMIGLIRVAIGFTKKWTADNLTGWIDLTEPQFATETLGTRWLFVVALAFRILLDFSGYSDMAIGFARMMGIVVPENFDWPYLARTPMEFWQRWHMSLSLWIRDYIYIPLGGNRLGLSRRVFNAVTAMALCGLWHGPDWNFVVWGLYHGAGLAIAALLQGRLTRRAAGADLPLIATPQRTNGAHDRGILSWLTPAGLSRIAVDVVTWAATMLFVGFGWLLFFYPVERAITMAWLLFSR